MKKASEAENRSCGTGTKAAYWQQRDEGDYQAVADWFADLRPAEVETFCGLADRVIARLDHA